MAQKYCKVWARELEGGVTATCHTVPRDVIEPSSWTNVSDSEQSDDSAIVVCLGYGRQERSHASLSRRYTMNNLLASDDATHNVTRLS